MNLSTDYLGLRLRTPLVPSSSPLSEDLNNLKHMEDAGAAAVVLHSMFEEQIRHEMQSPRHHLALSEREETEARGYFPAADDFQFAPARYLQHLAKAKEALGIPVIASLNGSTFGGWT